jgi:hypothetical protein
MSYWERRFGVSRRLIVKAVREVGGDPIEVRKWLRKRAQKRAR